MNTFDENLEINIEKPLFPNKRFHSGLRQYNKFMVDNNLIYQKNIDLKTSQITSLFNKSNEEGNMKMHNKYYNNKLIFFTTKVLKHRKTQLYLPFSLLTHIKDDLFFISTWFCLYIINLNTGSIQGSFIRRNLNEYGTKLLKGEIYKNKFIIFTNEYCMFIHPIEQLSQMVIIKLNDDLNLHSMNNREWLITKTMAIITLDENYNSIINEFDYAEKLIFCSESEVLSKENYQQEGKYCVFNLIRRTYKILRRKYYYIYKNENDKGGYILKSSPVFKQLPFTISNKDLYHIESSKNVFAILKEKKVYICNNAKIAYSFSFPSDTIHSIKEDNNKYYIHSKRCLFIYDAKTKELKRIINEQIQDDILKNKGRYYYIVISQEWIKLIDLYSNEVYKYIKWDRSKPIKRVISTKGHLLIIFSNYSSEIAIFDINTDKIISHYDIPEVKINSYHSYRRDYEDEKGFVFKMLTESIILLQRGYRDNYNLLQGDSLLIDIDQDKLILLNNLLMYITMLSNNRVLISNKFWVSEHSNEAYTAIYKYPFNSIQEEALFHCIYSSSPCYLAYELKNHNILIYNLWRWMFLYNPQTKETISLKPYIEVVDSDMRIYKVINAYEYKNNIVLFRDCEAHHYKEDEIVKGHVYALDLNEYKVLYTINPYDDWRYCLIFEPLKRMNVALSFDFSFLEIWNLELVYNILCLKQEESKSWMIVN